jgi:hypothetical protein
MTENGIFVLGGPETHLLDILWAVHDVKNHGRSEGKENLGEFPVTTVGRGRAMQCGFESTFATLEVLIINDNIPCGWTKAFIKYVSGSSII